MTTDTHIPDQLTQLGEALDRAVRADLADPPARHAQRVRRPRRLPRTRRLVVAIAATAVLVPAAADRRRHAAAQHRPGGRQPATGDARADGHRPELYDGDRERRIPLRARAGAERQRWPGRR